MHRNSKAPSYAIYHATPDAILLLFSYKRQLDSDQSTFSVIAAPRACSHVQNLDVPFLLERVEACVDLRRHSERSLPARSVNLEFRPQWFFMRRTQAIQACPESSMLLAPTLNSV